MGLASPTEADYQAHYLAAKAKWDARQASVNQALASAEIQRALAAFEGDPQ